MADLTCNNCGATLNIENQFVRTVTCAYCGSTYLTSGSSGLDMTGKTNNLADYPSRLQIGMRGQIKERYFNILGRIRYAYDAGFWEEWQIVWEDGAPPDWLEEDEGLWILYKRQRIKSAIPPYEEVKIGSTVSVNNQNVFVTEKRKARMLGAQGQFASTLPMQGEFGYFQGGANDQVISITYWDDEIELSVGEELDFQAVKFDS